MIPTILIVDDDPAFRETAVEMLEPESYRLLEAGSAEEALSLVAREEIDVVLADQRMPETDGLELTRRLRAASRPPEVVVLTGYGTIAQAVEAMRIGARDYLTKPLGSPEDLRQTVRAALGRRRHRPSESEEFLTRDPEVLQVLAVADRAANTDASILISGESGSGKELLARRIHRRSQRSIQPFVAVNCAALPETLAESELFGHERGAFTSAHAQHRGHFEQAHSGTLFLDEVSELSEPIQAKLLRAVDDRMIRRLGSEKDRPIDIRLISATNADLKQEVEAGRFRSDLFYRLRVVELNLPPLRHRPDDLALLIEALSQPIADELSLPAPTLSPRAMDCMGRHPWPGNVRELSNVLQRILITKGASDIDRDDLPDEILDSCAAHRQCRATVENPVTLKQLERQAILEALETSGGHRKKAAQLLGISVRTLYNRLRDYGIQ